MNLRAIAVSVMVGGTACLSAAVIAASPAQAPTLDQCQGMCPVVTQEPSQRPLSHTDRVGPRPTLGESNG